MKINKEVILEDDELYTCDKEIEVSTNKLFKIDISLFF